MEDASTFCGARTGKLANWNQTRIPKSSKTNQEHTEASYHAQLDYTKQGSRIWAAGVQIESKWGPLKYILAWPFEWPFKIFKCPLKGHLEMRLLYQLLFVGQSFWVRIDPNGAPAVAVRIQDIWSWGGPLTRTRPKTEITVRNRVFAVFGMPSGIHPGIILDTFLLNTRSVFMAWL